jgi:HSP20 family molecular chaperone IbpA
MQKQLLQHAKAVMLIASLIAMQGLRADFGLDDALQEMMHSVEKIQRKFAKVNKSIHTGMQNLMQPFVDHNGALSMVANDADIILHVAMHDIDKNSIKAVVHNKVLTIDARNKQAEMELVVDVASVKMNVQQKIEVASEEADKHSEKKITNISYNSQQIMRSLPAEILLDDVAVEYENGMLSVKLSRVNPIVSPKVINVIKK